MRRWLMWLNSDPVFWAGLVIIAVVADAMGLWSYFSRVPHDGSIIAALTLMTVAVAMRYIRTRRNL